jgi:acyl-CoA thioesterase
MTGFFDHDGVVAVPRPEARSPWSPDMLHGRHLAGLAARAVEASGPDPEMVPARLTIDLFRSAPMEPIELHHRIRRDGRRVRVDEVTAVVAGREVAATTIVLLRTGDDPSGRVWTRPDWEVPHPEAITDDLPEPSVSLMRIVPVDGRGFGTYGQKAVWLRDDHTLFDDEEVTPFQRAAMASDFISPLGNSGDEGLGYINADITLHMGRLPVGEWIGIEVGSHVARSGVSVTRSDLFDLTGAFGFAEACAVANPRMGG